MRPIDADVLTKRIQYLLLLGYRDAFDCLDEIDAAPTIDAVPVVRCKNCKHQRERNQHEKEYLIEGVLICVHPEVSEDCWAAVFPTHFCSYGERRSDETD